MQGSKREVQDKKLYVGWAESKVVAVNPTQEEFEKMGMDVEEEPVYQKEKDGETLTWVDFWMEELKTGLKYKRTFFVQDVPAKTTNKEEKPNFVEKTQYVNQIGDSFWAANKKDLSESFTKFRKKKGKSGDEYETYGDKTIRIAKKGEGDLMNFIKMWMGGCNFRDVNTNILLDMKKIFNGNFKEIKEQVGGEFTVIEKNGREYPSTIADVLEVKTVVAEDGAKEYQSVWRRPVAGWLMKSIRNTKFTRENIQKWKKEAKGKDNPEGVRWLKDYERVAVEISTGEHKSKNFYSLEPMHEYNSEDNFVSSGEAVTAGGVTDGDDDY